jgi:hypothetical protein
MPALLQPTRTRRAAARATIVMLLVVTLSACDRTPSTGDGTGAAHAHHHADGSGAGTGAPASMPHAHGPQYPGLGATDGVVGARVPGTELEAGPGFSGATFTDIIVRAERTLESLGRDCWGMTGPTASRTVHVAERQTLTFTGVLHTPSGPVEGDLARDLTMAVVGPDGVARCSDDGYELTLNPQVEVEAVPGDYEVTLGFLDGDIASAYVQVTPGAAPPPSEHCH